MDELSRKRAEKRIRARRAAEKRRRELDYTELVERAALAFAEYVQYRESAVENYRASLAGVEGGGLDPRRIDAIARALVEEDIDDELEEAG